MSLAASVKPAYVLGGLGVAAAPAVGYGGWKLYEGMDSPVGREFSDRGYRWNPPTPDLNAKPIPESDKYKMRTHKCFSNFFLDAEIKSAKATASDTTFPTFGWGTSDVDAGNPVGCALMQLDYKSNDDFVFTSEIVVKNDRVGMALWTTVTTTETEKSGHNFDPKSWAYYLLFLKKEEQLWRAVGGLFWVDVEVRNTYISAIKSIYISAPNDPWLNEGNPVSPAEAPFKKSYSGFWETAASGTEIFRDIKLYKTGGEANANILGRARNSGGSGDLFSSGTLLANAHYQNDQWSEYSGSKPDAAESLNIMYAPFKDKKGKWTSFNGRDDCTKWRHNREIGEADKRKLKILCYIDKER